MIATATTEVTLGARIPTRNIVLKRSRRLSTCARPSAASSCGTVDRTQMLPVLRSAFQKYGSASSLV